MLNQNNDQTNNQNQNQNTNLNQTQNPRLVSHPDHDPSVLATPEEWEEAERFRRVEASVAAEEERKAARHLADEYLPDPYEPDGTKRIWHDRRRGKIGRLPWALRREVNQRLVQEQPAKVILSWLNSLPEVRATLLPYFGKPEVTVQNLSEWRGGGFRE